MLSAKSTALLQGVHPDLVKVVIAAEAIMAQSSPKDTFMVTEGLRTRLRQQQLFNSGASKTMNSRHITGHAVDLAATVNSAPRWDWPLYFNVAKAMRQAALECGVAVVWGGVWDKPLADLEDPEHECSEYVARRRAAGQRSPFIDGPHFELDRVRYP